MKKVLKNVSISSRIYENTSISKSMGIVVVSIFSYYISKLFFINQVELNAPRSIYTVSHFFNLTHCSSVHSVSNANDYEIRSESK